MNKFRNKWFIISAVCMMALVGVYGAWKMWGVQGKGELPAGSAHVQTENEQSVSLPAEDLGGFYANDTYGFSFQYPEGFEANEFSSDSGGMVILVQKKDEKEEFQILVSPYDGDAPLTRERIKRDIPGITMDQPLDITIGGIPAILFWSDDSVVGKTREVWFVRGATLYQISSPAAFDPTLSRIMATWEFNKN